MSDGSSESKRRNAWRIALALAGLVVLALGLVVALALFRLRSTRPSRAATRLAAPDSAAGGRSGSLLDALDADGLTPLMVAARENDVATIAGLIAAGADPNRIDGRQGWTPLWHAVHKGSNAAVEALLSGGADPNFAPGDLATLLFAVEQGETVAVRQLLDAGADPRVATSDGANALVLAVEGGFLGDLDRADRLLGGCNDEMVRLLYERAPDLRLPPGFESRLAMKIALFHGCAETLQLLRSHGG